MTTESSGFEYRVANERLNFDQHEQAAQAWGGHVVSIANQQEFDHVRSLMQVDMWVGAKRKGGGNGPGAQHWEWADASTPWEFTNWSPGEPNNAGGRENRVHMMQNGKWNDNHGGDQRPAVYKKHKKLAASKTSNAFTFPENIGDLGDLGDAGEELDLRDWQLVGPPLADTMKLLRPLGVFPCLLCFVFARTQPRSVVLSRICLLCSSKAQETQFARVLSWWVDAPGCCLVGVYRACHSRHTQDGHRYGLSLLLLSAVKNETSLTLIVNSYLPRCD